MAVLGTNFTGERVSSKGLKYEIVRVSSCHPEFTVNLSGLKHALLLELLIREHV